MSLITKIVIDTAEYNRLVNIENEYKKLKAKYENYSEQSGSGTCSCINKKTCQCGGQTPPLSQIIALNEQARSVGIPPRGILPSITEPHQKNLEREEEKILGKKKEKDGFDHNEWRIFADDKTKWYFLGHYEEK